MREDTAAQVPRSWVMLERREQAETFGFYFRRDGNLLKNFSQGNNMI